MPSYHRPSDVAKAVALHSSSSGSAYLAGGQTLLAALNRRERAYTQLIDIRKIAALRGIDLDSRGLRIGAAVTLNEVLSHREALAAMPVLREALSHVANHTVRNCSTIGGHVALADGWSEVNLILLAASAAVTTDRRQTSVRELLAGHRKSALLPGELIQSVLIEPQALVEQYGFCEFTLRASGGRAMVAAVVRGSGTDAASAVVMGVTSSPIFLDSDALKNTSAFLGRVLDAGSDGIESDSRWPREYRHRLGVEAIRRAGLFHAY